MSVSVPLRRNPAPLRIAKACLPVLWRSRLVPEPELEEARLLDAACEQTGLDEFGDPWFRRPFAQLVEAVRSEANLNPVGQTVARIHLLKLLKERLRAEQWFADHPAIRQRRLAPPVVIVGPMRSGSTRLHRLLSADRRFAHLRMFETMCPVPPAAGERDRRPAFAARSLRLLHGANPATAVVHPTGPFEPEEELGLLVVSAWGMKHEVQWRVPSYARWCEGEDAVPAYRYMADLLRLTGWLRGEPEDLPWVLKTPQHMLDLDALLAVFPHAKLIFLHRDPVAVVGSSCSMVWNQMIVQSDTVDRRWIGREWLRKTRLMLRRMREARTRVCRGQAIDIDYEDMNRDWRREMRRVYAFLGLDMGPAEAAMAAYVTRSEHDGAYRGHRYDLAWFGLAADRVREELGNGAAAPAAAAAVPRDRATWPSFLDGVAQPLFGRTGRAAAAD